MRKVKDKLKNLIYSLGFLFRPITPVAVSFVFLALTCTVLVVVIINMDEKSKAYEISLSILTGVTASLLIAIMMELYNNYRFNTKRQRELRGYFSHVAMYEISQSSILEVDSEYKSDDALGKGRAYAVFRNLSEIIPILREALNNRDYLHRIEIDEIDDILYSYDNTVRLISIHLLPAHLRLTTKRHDETSDQELIDDELLADYPMLRKFLETEAKYYVENKYNPDFHDKDTKQLEHVIEKAIFRNRGVFNEYFEVTDTRYQLANLKVNNKLSNKLSMKIRNFEFLSNWISYDCGNIDKSMIKLQKRLAKEPYIWTIASYIKKD